MIGSALWDRWLRAAFDRANGVLGALGIFVVAGLLIGIAGTGAFVKLASEVREGETQTFGFCMATLEAIQRFGLRRAPEILRDEKAAPDASAP